MVVVLLLVLLVLLPCTVSAQSSDAGETAKVSESNEAPPAKPAESEAGTERTTLNLLGEVDASSGESRRNENVDITLVDNNVLKELNIRMGPTATIVRQYLRNSDSSFTAPLDAPRAEPYFQALSLLRSPSHPPDVTPRRGRIP